VDIWVFVQKNIFLVGVCVASGAMLLWPLITRAVSGGGDVSALEAVQLINRRDAIVLDVRDAADYAAGHIANARHIPAAEIAKRADELSKFRERPILVSCQSGTRAAGAASQLRKLGFKEVFPLKGGVLGWQQASLPLERK